MKHSDSIEDAYCSGYDEGCFDGMGEGKRIMLNIVRGVLGEEGYAKVLPEITKAAIALNNGEYYD